MHRRPGADLPALAGGRLSPSVPAGGVASPAAGGGDGDAREAEGPGRHRSARPASPSAAGPSSRARRALTRWARPRSLRPCRSAPRVGSRRPRRRASAPRADAAAAAGGPVGESRRRVTVLFSDLAGSTALGERLDPESLRRVMARYYDEMRGVIERHGGVGGEVHRRRGDGGVRDPGAPRGRRAARGAGGAGDARRRRRGSTTSWRRASACGSRCAPA